MLRRKPGIILCIFLAGLVVGHLARQKMSVSSAQGAGAQSAALEVGPASIASRDRNGQPGLKKDLGYADGLLLEGDIAGANEAYESLARSAEGVTQLELKYRRGICYELLSEFEQALANYQSVVGQSTPTQIALAARLGQARVWIHSQLPELAKPLLFELLLNSPPWIPSGDAIQRESQQLLADVFANEAMQVTPKRLIDPKWIAQPALIFRQQLALDLVAESHSTAAQATRPDTHVTVDDRAGQDPQKILLTVLIERMAVHEVVQLLARTAQLNVEWSTQAQEESLARTTQMAVSRLSLANILDAVLDPIGCVWEFDKGTIHVRRTADVPTSVLAQIYHTRATRMLQQTIAANPDDQSTPASYLALANLAFADGHPDQAVASYQRLLQLFPRLPIKAEAYFNLAKAYMLLGDNGRARESLYKVADSAPGHALEPMAYLYLGHLHLEEGEAAKAIKPLARAVALATDRELRNLSILTLAAAYLVDQKSIAANQVLMEHSALLRSDPDRKPAAFLSAMAGFRTAATRSQVEREGRRLLAALTHVKPADFFGSYGYALLGEAYRDLQLEDSLVETYETALKEGVGNHWGELITYELAAVYFDHGEFDKAHVLLAALIASSGSAWIVKARLKMAEISFVTGKDRECLEACRQLFTVTEDSADKASILRLMGRVYERQGNHEQAAMCFGGIVPNDDPPTEREAERALN